MSKSYEIQGQIHSIGATTEYGNNGFTKREFVIKLTGNDENERYPNYVALELIKDKCSLMDSYSIGDEITAQFNLSGRLWSGNDKPEKCFTSLQAWKVDPLGSGTVANDGDSYGAFDQTVPNGDFDDDIPF
ncbi:DUF3127 domain-containing protein [Halieaceae bacterium]|nr:DUF3127 domain-containing protein [Halieaceae bacterium]